MAVVRVFVMDAENRVLLVKTKYKKKDGHYWIVPGGMIEKGEYSKDAAIREVKEETGLDIAVIRLVWVEEGKIESGDVDFIHYFLGEVTHGEKIVGIDPELDADQQKIVAVEYKSRDEIAGLTDVYPEVLAQQYFWDVIRTSSHNPYVNRPTKGFGLR